VQAWYYEGMQKKERKVAFFDIDGTIFRSSLLIELVEELAKQDIFPKDAVKVYEHERNRWLDRKGTYEEYIDKVVLAFMKHVKGVYYGDLKDAGKAVMKRYQHRVYRYTRMLVSEYAKRGYMLVAISHSPKAIVDSFCKRMGFDKVYGMVYDIGPTDCFTGEIIDEHLIRNKGSIVRRVVEKEGVTLTGSVAVGDTEGDIAMLEAVQKPICFNPNQALYRYAKRRGWKVIVERKDVVYTIE